MLTKPSLPVKLYALMVAIFGIASLSVAVWGTEVTAQFLSQTSLDGKFQTEYWLGLAFLWFFGVGALVCGVGMSRKLYAMRHWELFAWLVASLIVIWSLVDVARDRAGIENLVEIAIAVALAASGTLLRWRVGAHVAT